MKEERTAMKKGLAIIISLMMATAFAAISIGSPMQVAAESYDDYDIEEEFGGEDFGDEDYDEDVDEDYDEDYAEDEEGADEDGAEEESEESQYFEVPGSSGSFNTAEHTVYANGSDSIVFDGVGLSANGGSVRLDLTSGSYEFYPAQGGGAFLGWNTSADGMGDSFSPGESMDLSSAQSLGTLYADWEGSSDDEDTNDDNQDVVAGPTDGEDYNDNDQNREVPPVDNDNDVTVPEDDSNDGDEVADDPIVENPVDNPVDIPVDIPGDDDGTKTILPVPNLPDLPTPENLIPDLPTPENLIPDLPAPTDLIPNPTHIGDNINVGDIIKNLSFNFNQDNRYFHTDNSIYESFTNWLPWDADYWYYPHWHKDPECAPEEPVRTDTGETYTPDCGIVQTGDEDSWMIYLAAVMLFVSLAAGIAFIVLRRREKEQEMEDEYWMN